MSSYGQLGGDRGGYSSYQAGGQSYSYSENENEFTRLSKSVSTNIQKIVKNVAELQRLVQYTGTAKDSQDLRDKVHEIQHYTNQVAKETTSYLKELAHFPQPSSASDQRQRKMQNERLRSEFSDALNNFQSVQRLTAEKERASVIRARAHSGYGPMDFAEEKKNDDQLIYDGGFSQTKQVLQMEEDVDIELIQEREEAILKLESDIRDVNQIFKELGVMVHEQGEGIDSIEANVVNAEISIEAGVVQLENANKYKKRSRRNLCVVLLIVLAVIVLLSLIVWAASS
ncbi:syntaxin-7 isoform X2 [Argonauta hians]